MKMNVPIMEVVRFGAEDVIATSGAVGYSINTAAASDDCWQDTTLEHTCNNSTVHLFVTDREYHDNNIDGYWCHGFDESGDYVECFYRDWTDYRPYTNDRFAAGSAEHNKYYVKNNAGLWTLCSN